MELHDKAIEFSENTITYTVEIGMNERGELKALTNKLSIGAILYKKSIAKKYMGI